MLELQGGLYPDALHGCRERTKISGEIDAGAELELIGGRLQSQLQRLDCYRSQIDAHT